MKNLFYVLSITFLIISCSNEPKDYVTLSGTITNQNSDSLVIRSKTYSKTIKVNTDGTFSDTLRVETGFYNIFDGTEGTGAYLKNGYDLKLTLDTKQFDETVKFEGIGAEPNNYLAARALKQEQVYENQSIYDLEKPVFDQKIAEYTNEFKELLKNTQNTDSLFVANEEKGIAGFMNFISSSYEDQQYLRSVLAKGNPSPKFVDYENFKGGKTSLDNLKGKYVYVDVWATWCGPCKAEIPFLKEIEKNYRNKNIEFVSISIDEAKNHDKWVQMVTEKQLEGVQLFADNDWNSQFVKDYRINGIPRFILIDPNGNIVTPDAPRPSSEELIKLFNELAI